MLSIIQNYPRISLVFISIVVTFLTSLVYKYATNQSRLKELKQIQKDCRIKLNDAKGNPEKMMEIQNKMMECSTEMMKHSFKPMLITMIPLFIVLALIGSTFSPLIPGHWLFPVWTWYYLVCGIVANMIFRKFLNIY